MPHFFFSACQPGAERMLKAEARAVRPDLRPAFARPGLVTWKTDVDSIPELTFARRSGASIGPAETAEAVIAAARATGANRIHAWEREPVVEVSGGPDAPPFTTDVPRTDMSVLRTVVINAGLEMGGPARIGERVL